MYELLNHETMEHETLLANEYYAAVEEAKKKASVIGGKFWLIDNVKKKACL